MWKRLNNARGARQSVSPAIGDPHIDISHNEKYAAALGVHKQYPEKNMPPARPPRDDLARSLPQLPFEPVSPPPDYLPLPPGADSRYSVAASSVYSQPTPDPTTVRFPHRREVLGHYSAYPEEDVSPPSSPEFAGRTNRSRGQNEGELSPSSDNAMPDISQLSLSQSSTSRAPKTSIPVLRRDKLATDAQNLTRKEVGGPKGRTAHDPRWDPYSGEITTSDRGKPQSVKPGSFTPPGLRPVHKETGLPLGNVSSVTGATPKQHTSFRDRVQKFKNDRNILQAESRPPWKGASTTGRTTFVAPVEDQLDMPPLSIPPKSARRGTPVSSPQSESHSGGSTPVPTIRSDDGETSPAMAQMSSYSDATPRSVRSGSGHNSPLSMHPPSVVTPDPVVINESAATRHLVPGNQSPPENTNFNRDETFKTIGNIERQFRSEIDEHFPSPIADYQEPHEQPPSRFSVTTYAASEAQTTPRPSTETFDQHPVPEIPRKLREQPSNSILDRKRPLVGSQFQSSSPVIRKPLVPGTPVFISMSKRLSTSTTASNKLLPLSPAELAAKQANDLVISLQSQLDELAHRRNNITRSIRQMTELMPKDHVLLTDQVRKKREMEKLKVEQLRSEESEVRREEHDIGLRLHRAYKRRERDAVYEPTGLWVRRVTG